MRVARIQGGMAQPASDRSCAAARQGARLLPRQPLPLVAEKTMPRWRVFTSTTACCSPDDRAPCRVQLEATSTEATPLKRLFESLLLMSAMTCVAAAPAWASVTIEPSMIRAPFGIAWVELVLLSGVLLFAFRVLNNQTRHFPENEIDPVAELPELKALPEFTDQSKVKELLSQTAVLKLNGGLGTSMGLEKAKSLLVVKDGKTFLDLIAEQVKIMRTTFGSNVVFTLMNSFATSDDTKDFLKKNHSDLLAEPFIELMQNSSPKVDAATLLPASHPDSPECEWCPPGHGDIYPSLLGSGMLDKLISSGIKYLFVSNSDNLGATLDLQLLNYFASSGKAFLMEVCERTGADKKGGHLCLRKSDGKFMLRESAMCPDNDKPAFEDIFKHKFFNTNNLWVHLETLRDTLVGCGGALDLPLIKNKKTVNPRDSSSAVVFQLETAMGSAIECFDQAGAIVVPRTRFAPVKTCADLFVLRSDAYTISKSATVVPALDKVPLVKLDDKHYKLVDQMEALVDSIPSLVHATSLTVKGKVKFCAGVTIKGDVVVEAGSEEGASLAAGEYNTGTVKL